MLRYLVSRTITKQEAVIVPQCHHINVLLSHIVNTAQVVSMTDRNNVSIKGRLKEDYLTVLALAKNVIKRCPNLLTRYGILRSV